MPERSGTPGCLDDETLAAYVDGGLTAEERSQVELHLAACQDCFAVFTESVKTVQAMEDDGVVFADVAAPVPVAPAEPTPAIVVPMPPRRSALTRRLVMAGGLAAAAAMVLAVWWARFPGRGVEGGQLAELVAAASTTRPFEPRLTGGFQHTPVVSQLRGKPAQASPAVTIAVARLEKALLNERSPVTLANYARGALIEGKRTEAIESLDLAARMAPSDARILNDLAAAYLVQATSGDSDPFTYAPLAVDAAKRATLLDANVSEAWFNLALAHETLEQPANALAAWERYIAVERDVAWRSEGISHLENLRQSMKRSGKSNDE